MRKMSRKPQKNVFKQSVDNSKYCKIKKILKKYVHIYIAIVHSTRKN